MTVLSFNSELTANLLKVCADDIDVVAAAQISTKGDAVLEAYLDTDGQPMTAERFVGLVNFLMKNRHGTPFEHNYFRFFVKAPIAVFREYQRHRIGFSYNEESGRYKQLAPEFYLPPRHRPLVQVGKPGAYTFTQASTFQWADHCTRIKKANAAAYEAYEGSMADGIAKESARLPLPVNLYSSMWVSCNARSIMSFLSLRTTKKGFEDCFGEEFEDIPDPLFPSGPMWEIEQIGLQMERAFAQAMPLTHRAFRMHGTVSP